jgi:hypothetical protein
MRDEVYAANATMEDAVRVTIEPKLRSASVSVSVLLIRH